MASFNFNKATLGGHLASDPELKQTQNGVYVTSFSLAVNRRFAKEGEQQQADFFQCVAWKDRAEFICKHFRKGSALCVTGELQTRNYTDQQGVKRYVTELRVDDAYFVESKGEAAPAQQGAYNGYAQNPAGAAQGGAQGGFNGQPTNYPPNYQNGAQAQNWGAQPQGYGQPMQAMPQGGQFTPVSDDKDLPF